MITEQQKNALIPGDIVLIRGIFNRLDEEGDLEISHSYTPHTGAAIATTSSYADRTCVELPPRPPSTRRFKKGDIVRVEAWNGRHPYDTHHGLKPSPGEVHIVIDDEYDRNEVHIGMSAADEHQSVVHACHLELVTPVEDTSPWRVKELQDSFIVYHDGTMAAKFKKNGHPDAHAAAIAERNRLNAEHLATLMQH